MASLNFQPHEGQAFFGTIGMLKARFLRRLRLGPIGFRLEARECVSVSGRSGAGKSPLLRMVADLDPHDGDVCLDGAPCSTMAGVAALIPAAALLPPPAAGAAPSPR